MIQKARGANSRSLLREIEYCALILDDDNKEEYFKRLFQDIIEKRSDPDITYTGAKAARQQLLACLSQLGEIATANVWARYLIVDLAHINALKDELDQALREQNIYGIVEIHLQDREILSPHIQFVGIRAEEAQQIIAQVLIKNKYELSIGAAIGSVNTPKPYEYDSGAVTQSLSKELSFEKDIEEVERIKEEVRQSQDIDISINIKKKREEFLKALSEFSDDILEGIIDRKELPKTQKMHDFGEVKQSVSKVAYEKDKIQEKVFAMPKDEFSDYVEQIQSVARARKRR